MFLKYLKIQRGAAVIRDIRFRKGINLIIDESCEKITGTGNGVGKTTVLKLIDFCLGAKKSIFWENPENKKQSHDLVKNYLTNTEQEILISLCLTNSLDEQGKSQEILIERNFISTKSKSVNKINEQAYATEDSFKQELKRVFFSRSDQEKPTFRQIISHNFRYDDQSLSNTLKTLHQTTSDQEYEALHLFLFGCDTAGSVDKEKILEKIKQEEKFKRRLEEGRTKSEIEISLSLVDNDIQKLNQKRNNLNINENFEQDLDTLNQVRYKINDLSSRINQSKIRRSLILEAKKDLDQDRFNSDLQQLKVIYNQTKNNFSNLQKSFEDLVTYHNTMLKEKILFITKELPSLEKDIQRQEEDLRRLLEEEVALAKLVKKSDTYEQLEELIQELGDKYRQKGEYESLVSQLRKVDSNLKDYYVRLDDIEKKQFSEEFEEITKLQVEKFSKYFAAVSEELYGKRYALKCDISKHSKTEHRSYKFSTFVPDGPNNSSGTKQGEISSFDIAYILFADAENMPCMHFILNDKKELMHDNQLVKIAHLANNKNIQFVASILQDKLPEELNRDEYIILKLSEDDKLFRIEKQFNP